MAADTVDRLLDAVAAHRDRADLAVLLIDSNPDSIDADLAANLKAILQP